MTRRRARRNLPPAPPASLTLRLDPDVPLQVKLSKLDKPPASLSPWLYAYVVLTILVSGAWLFLWGSYVLPRSYSPPIDAPPVSVTLVQPAYVAFGDEAGLEVTVTNRGTDPVTGTVTVMFTGPVAARPVPPETTTAKFDGLAGGASVTQRLKFALAQTPAWFSQDTVRLALQVTVGEQRVRPATELQMLIAPLPYLSTVTSVLFGSAFVSAVAAFLWDIFKKRVLNVEAG